MFNSVVSFIFCIFREVKFIVMKNIQKSEKKDRKEMIQYINLQLAALGQPLFTDNSDAGTKYANARFISLTESLINSFREK